VYDDLTKHAAAYRQVSFCCAARRAAKRNPRRVLPAFAFERAARLNEDYGGGSLTALPLIETQANDVSAYILTNGFRSRTARSSGIGSVLRRAAAQRHGMSVSRGDAAQPRR